MIDGTVTAIRVRLVGVLLVAHAERIVAVRRGVEEGDERDERGHGNMSVERSSGVELEENRREPPFDFDEREVEVARDAPDQRVRSDAKQRHVVPLLAQHLSGQNRILATAERQQHATREGGALRIRRRGIDRVSVFRDRHEAR